ncbi:MAG TPA: Hsp20 family protein [bacterium]|nr:Hsp20 family protein [bacterium]
MAEREVPVNIYREGGRLMIAAPLPGMEPGSVRIDVRGRQLTIDAALRGPGQNRTQEYLQREWSVGPYRRMLELPLDVDAAAANAVYNNGVLVVMLPVGGDGSPETIRMAKVGTTRGRRTRRRGKTARPSPSPAADPRNSR